MQSRNSRGGSPRRSSGGSSRNSGGAPKKRTSGRKKFSGGPKREGGSSSRSGGGYKGKSDGRSGGGYRGGGRGRGPARGKGGRGRDGNRGGGGRKMPTFDPTQFINTNPAELKEETYTPKNTFGTFGLDERIVATTKKMGIVTPSPIQDQIIPEIMKGRDVIGLAETGTGKTAAFLVPLIDKTIHEPKRTTLILTPTRELAIQIEHEFRKLADGLRQFGTVCVGGVGISPQIKALKKHNHFIIGTPGRVLDLINRGNLKTNIITTVVLDEADRMLDMGFIHDMRKILKDVPTDRETLFFSATMDPAAKKLVHEFLKDPVTVSVKKKDVTDSIAQDVVHYGHDTKFETLTNLLKDDDIFNRVIIFGAMKHSVQKLAVQLTKSGIKSEAIHGNKSHSQRQRALKNFKENKVRVLVATDVAARGIHVDEVSHVINYDLPNTKEDYIHRIGRTGRGTERGKALTFVQHK